MEPKNIILKLQKKRGKNGKKVEMDRREKRGRERETQRRRHVYARRECE